MNNSIDRASSLLGISRNEEDFVSVKLKVDYCACLHCIPDAYKKIDEYISPFCLLEKDVKSDEKDILLSKGKEEFVLEFHESGPEIVFYSTISGLLVVAITELVKVMVSAFKSSRKHGMAKVTLIKRRILKGKLSEEIIMKIDLSKPVGQVEIENAVKKSLKPK